MKKLAILCVIAIIIFIPNILRAQNNDLKKEITVTKQVLSGHELLDEISEITDYKFFYSESVINIPSKVELSKTKGSIQSFLDEIFADQDVEYMIKDKTIFIKTILKETNKKSIFITGGIIIKGKIIDQKTNKIIPYANIAICDHPIGVASTEFGEFILKIPSTFKNNDLCINVIGYYKYSQKINSIDINNYLIIKLEPKIYNIEAVEITEKRKSKFKNPEKIVQMAIKNIKNNYPLQQFNLQGYYREYIKHENTNYLNLLEAALVIKDNGFSSDFFPYNARTLQLRFNNNFNVISDFNTLYNDNKNNIEKYKYIPNHIMPTVGGNELSILFAHDPIRRFNESTCAFIYTFSKDFVNSHDFYLDSIIDLDNIPLYCISFSYKNNLVEDTKNKGYIRKHNIHGKILIRSNSWAIERLEYCSYLNHNKKDKTYELIVNYKNHNGKMYLNYLAFLNSFKVKLNQQSAHQLKISENKQPFIIEDIFIKHDSLFLSFNKKIRKLSCKNGNFIIEGFVTENNNFLTDTIYLSKKPKNIDIINSNKIKITINHLNQVISNLNNENNITSGVNNSFESVGLLHNNQINIGNLSIKIDQLKDAHGNKLNDLFLVDMYQFREFFVNDIPKEYSDPEYSRFIFSDIPLYKQIPQFVENFWDLFNYPSTEPLLKPIP
ncbi:MAG: carboxypeptidase-like regulatory domain-containing protein [Bacteroidales bacterium]|nr:carboxypeptidase-like regulatory domain-containing protein [Bacteroidales bacterium]